MATTTNVRNILNTRIKEIFHVPKLIQFKVSLFLKLLSDDYRILKQTVKRSTSSVQRLLVNLQACLLIGKTGKAKENFIYVTTGQRTRRFLI